MTSERHILVIDPVGTDRWVEADSTYLGSLARDGTTIRFVPLEGGPATLESAADEVAAIPGILRRVQELGAAHDGVMINCFLDPGVEAARELLDLPVAGPAESALIFAALRAERFSILSVGQHLAARHRRQARTLGLADRLASVVPLGIGVADLERDPAFTIASAVRLARQAVDRDGAAAIVLGCTGMARLAADIGRDVPVPVLEPAACALKMLETTIDLDLRHSRRGLYGRPDPGKLGQAAVSGCQPGPLPGREVSARPGGSRRLQVIIPVTGDLGPGAEPYLDHRVAGPMKVDTSRIASGPASIETVFDEAFAVPAILQLVKDVARTHDGVMVNCFADPGVEAARELVRVPVLGIGEASLLLATTLGNRFSVISTPGNAGAWLDRQLRSMGLTSRLASAAGIDIPVLALSRDVGATVEALVRAGREAVDHHGAEVIVLGCGAMAAAAASVRQRLEVPVVEPAAAALRLLGAMVEMERVRLEGGDVTGPVTGASS
jgi:allantoin racemase